MGYSPMKSLRFLTVYALAIGGQSVQAQDIPPSEVAQGPQPGIVRAACDPTGCDELAVAVDATLVSRPGLALKRIRLHTYRSEGGVRRAKQDEVGAVACSPTRPAVVAEREGRRIAVYLAPDAPALDPRYVNVVATYFAVCHGPTLARAAVADFSGTAARLGYDVPALATRAVPIHRVEDVLAPPREERRIEARGNAPMLEDRDAPIPPRPIPDDYED